MRFIIINYILEEFIFGEKRLNEISENKFSSKITCYTVFSQDAKQFVLYVLVVVALRCTLDLSKRISVSVSH